LVKRVKEKWIKKKDFGQFLTDIGVVQNVELFTIEILT
jgi:hypothetical protein